MPITRSGKAITRGVHVNQQKKAASARSLL